MARQFGPCGEITVQGGPGGVVESISLGNSVAAASSGELFNVNPGTGKRVIITGLAPNTGTEGNIEIKFGTRIVFTGDITDAVQQSALTIMQGYPNTTTNEYLGVGTISELKGYQEEVLSISKTTGSTGLTIYLSYIITD